MASLLTKLKLKRRWLQVSLRTMLVLVTLLCVALSIWVVPAERQRRAVAGINSLGAHVRYRNVTSTTKRTERFPKTILRRWLPRDFFDRVDEVHLPDAPDFLPPEQTEAVLIHVERLTDLLELRAYGTPVTDAGLVHVQGLTHLQVLDLEATRISDAGLFHLRGMTGLRELNLWNTRVGDAGLVNLCGMTALKELYLVDTQVTDTGLAHLQGLTGLEVLRLDGTRVTDAGLVHLRELTNLEMVTLADTAVTDAGLVHLAGLANLERLYLEDTQITGVGLASLLRSPLRLLRLERCRISDAALASVGRFMALETNGT